MIKDQLAELVAEAALIAQERGTLPAVTLPISTVEHPQKPEHGDYASTLSMKLAKAAGMKPMDIAFAIHRCLPDNHPAIEKVTTAPPGFLNFTLRPGWLQRQVGAILDAGQGFGFVDVGHGQRVQIEYVSANPTGPVHIGNGRGGVLGSALAAVLRAAGYQVQQEYYINDTGAQMGVFQRSIWARYLQALGQDVPMPEDGYGGDYMVELARNIAVHEGDRFAKPPEAENQQALAELGMKTLLAGIKTDLEGLGVHYDEWYSERSLFQDGTYERAMAVLKAGGHVAEREGAQWFQSTALGEDKDNVLVRTSGIPTYFASDAAYHYNKFLVRKFDRVINIWGADHQGHVSRVKAITAALGGDASKLDVLLTQLVTLKRGAEVVRLSKRSGDIIALSDVLDEVGKDACRFFFLARSADSQMDFDLELAKKQSNENPVYYVQYGHARTAGVLRTGVERGVEWQDGDVSLLNDPAELALIRKMLQLPEVIETAAVNLEPHHLAHFAQDLATTFHNFYEQCRVITDDVPLSQARLKLVAATQHVLARTLGLMGLSAPERM